MLPGPAAGRHASMGNCQAAETATVLIQHPGGGRTERAYWALSAGAVMAANPGHYVAAVITVPQPGGAGDGAASAAAPVKHLKLLRPADTLLLGRVYRLVSFEEVLREFASNKRQVKLSRVTVRTKDEDEDVKPASKHLAAPVATSESARNPRGHSPRSCARRRSWRLRQTRRRAPAPSTGKPTPTRQPTWRPSCRTGRCSAIEPPGNGGPRCRASQKAEGEWPG